VINWLKLLSQNANELEKNPNDAAYYGELDIICILIDCMMCWDTSNNQKTIDLRKLLLDKEFIPSEFRFLADVGGHDYIQELKNLKPEVDAILKRLEDEKIELKVDMKYLRRPSPDNLANVKMRLYRYFAENPDEPPEDMSAKDKCAYRQRQIFTLSGSNMNGILELQWKKTAEQELVKVHKLIEQNILSGAASACDYLVAISTNLALTSINHEWCQNVKFETMLDWSKLLYETRQMLNINSKRNLIYLEPYLFMTMFNWPRQNPRQIVPPSVVVDALNQWKDEFSKKYARYHKEGRLYNRKEKLYFSLPVEVTWSLFIHLHMILADQKTEVISGINHTLRIHFSDLKANWNLAESP